MPYTSIVWDTDYIIVEATDAYLEMTMRKREDIVGKKVFDAFPDNPDDPNSKNTGLLRQSIDNAIKTRKPDVMDLLRYDIPRPEADGGGFETKYWDVTHVPVLDDDGEVKYIIQKTGDATERVRTQKELKDSQERANFIAESMPQLIWMNDKDGKLIYINHRWEEYSGIPNATLMNDIWNTLVHPEDIENAKNAWLKALESKESYQVQTRIKNKDGQYRWFLSRAIPKLGSEGNVKYWVGSATDMHDTKLMVDELETSNEYLSDLSDKVQDAYEKAEDERKLLERLIMEAPAMICITRGPKHEYELANPIYQATLPGRELIGRKVAEAIPEAVELGFITLLDKVYNEGETVIGKEMFLPLERNGIMEDAYFTFTYQPLYNRDKIVGIVTFAIEVTDTVNLRKKLEALETTN